MSKEIQYDAIVAGAGVAGIRAAAELSKQGMTVALVDHTIEHPQEKSLFIDISKLPPLLQEKIDFHPIQSHQLINADDPSKNWGKTGDFNTGATDYRPLFEVLMDTLPPDVEIIPEAVRSSSDDGKKVQLRVGRGQKNYPISSRYLVDASGDGSPVSRQHKTSNHERLIDDDPLVAWMIGFRALGNFDPDTVYDPIGKEIGSTSWVTPLSATKGDIIASGISRLSQAQLGRRKPLLDNLVQFCEEQDICEVSEITDPLGGVLRSEPITLENVSRSNVVWQIGQSAGMADPLFAEAFTPALLHAEKLAEYMADGKLPKDFYCYWRYSKEGQLFDYDLMLAMLQRRSDYFERGIVGSNTAIYKVITELLSESASELALKERRLPIAAYIPLLKNFLKDHHLRQNILELAGIYAQTLINTNVLPRLIDRIKSIPLESFIQS